MTAHVRTEGACCTRRSADARERDESENEWTKRRPGGGIPSAAGRPASQDMPKRPFRRSRRLARSNAPAPSAFGAAIGGAARGLGSSAAGRSHLVRGAPSLAPKGLPAALERLKPAALVADLRRRHVVEQSEQCLGRLHRRAGAIAVEKEHEPGIRCRRPGPEPPCLHRGGRAGSRDSWRRCRAKTPTAVR